MRASRRRCGAAAALAVLGTVACSAAGPPAPGVWTPSRWDYYAFRAAYPDVVEPNYLPFMAHALDVEGGRVLAFCHWEAEDFPLAVYVESPEIPPGLQDEFAPIPPEAYVAAAESALDAWERELEGLVRFRRVADADAARLRIHLRPEVAPAPEPTVSVLGRIALGRACRVRGPGSENRVDVHFEASDVLIYLADEYGLLNPDQVATVTMHEIGHALGMRGHSPIPADLMFPIARDDPRARGPSELDVNSFVSLFSLPNGAIFRRLEPGDERPPPRAAGPPPGPPLLAAAPHVDARFGYELRLPPGWERLRTAGGMISTDGLAWDYDATFQVIVRGYRTVGEYLARNAAAHVGSGRVVEERRIQVDGRPALRMVVADRLGPMMEELTFVEVGDGRVVVVIADCARDAYPAYRPWFAAILDSLEIRPLAPRP